jgi:DNA-binding transcriptional MerR regulator
MAPPQGLNEGGEAMAEYRIDDLARAAGTTVRNVRLYQERGLLPPPRREGRVGIYTDAHLARLRLIAQLLDRGYTYANIAELVSAWQHGRDLAEVLGLEEELTGPWSDEIPDYTTLNQLRQLFGIPFDAKLVRRAIKVGVIEPEGRRFRVPSPRLLHAAVELSAVGISLGVILDIAERLQRDIEDNTRQVVQIIADHVLAGRDPDWLPVGEEIPQLKNTIHRLRPLTRQIREVLGERLSQVLLSTSTSTPSSTSVTSA